MKIRDLKRIIAELPDDAAVSIYSSYPNDEMAIQVVEWYEPGKGNTLMLLDRHADPSTGCKVLYDSTGDEQ